MASVRVQKCDVITPDGVRLHCVEHLPMNAVGTVLLVHGLGEHSGRYTHVIEVLNRSGLQVVQFDHRGHGISSGQRGHVNRYEDYLDDVTLILRRIVKAQPQQKIVLYGHSMGGGIVANWALQRFDDEWSDCITGAVLSAPWFRLSKQLSGVRLFLVQQLSRMVPTLGIPSNLRVQDLCRAEDAIERFKKDSLNHRQITVRTAWECWQAGRWALENSSRFPIPILAIHGSADRVTSPTATREFCRPILDARFVPLDNLIHEPHHDPQWREVVYHVTEWILKRHNFAFAA